jgi:hypothetical protein
MSLAADLIFPRVQIWGDTAAVARADVGAAAEHFAPGSHRGSVLGEPGNEFLWGRGALIRAWPASPDDDAYARVRTSQVETLLIGGTVDGATPAANATGDLLPYLPNGHQVVLSEFGHTTDFWNTQPRAGSHLINAFLDTGEVDASRYTHQAIDFTPGLAETTLAKGIADIMVGLAIVALLSLVWMARRVRTQRRIGRRAGAVLRSAYAPVLGLGGWFLGALVAMTALPGVPLDSEPLAVVCIGTPIALGIYWAWADRDRPAAAKSAGVAAAGAGALLGAWLGYGAATGLLALLTTVAGAAAGANLALIARDIAAQASGRARAPATAAEAE